MPTKWLHERAKGSKNEHGMPPRRASSSFLARRVRKGPRAREREGKRERGREREREGKREREGERERGEEREKERQRER